MLRILRCALPLGLALSAATLLAASTPKTAAELFFGPPDFDAPAISPDGQTVAFIAQTNGHACLFKLELKTGQISGVFSAGDGEVKSFWWTGSQRVLVCGGGEEGNEYFVQDLANSKPRPVPSLKGAPTDWIIVPSDNSDYAYALNFWREAYLSRIDLKSGHSTMVESFISDFRRTVASKQGELRAKVWDHADKWHVAWRASASQPWQTIESSVEDWPPFTPAGMAPDDHHILVYAYDQGDKLALMQLDPDTGQRTMLGQQPDHDAYGLFKEGRASGYVGVKFYNNATEDLVFFDEAAKQFSAALDRSLPGMIHRVKSTSTDGSKRIIEAWLPGYPSRFLLFDNVQHRLSVLGEQRPDLTAGTLGQIHPFQFKTRDGVEEFGYVLLPPRHDQAKPAPLLVMVPQAAGEWPPLAGNFSPDDQYFASRGMAVAHFSTRGSAGFGRAFAKAGDFQQAGKIVLDLEDGVHALAQAGLIDPQRVALMGYKFGGLFALRTAANSTAFHAVVAFNAPCDLTANAIGSFSSSIAETPVVMKQAGGTQASFDLVHQFEPESFMEKLSVPVMLAYGSWYGYTSSVREAGLLRSSFERHHKPYEWYELDYRASDHVRASTYDMQFFPKIADFLEKSLK